MSDPEREDFSEGLKLIFTDAVENLRFLKQQQWSIVRYALTAYGALFAIAAVLKVEDDRKFIFLAAVMMVLAFAMMILASMRDAFAKFRDRLKWIYANRLQTEQAEGLNLKKDESYFNTEGFILYLAIVTIFGAWIAIEAIARL